MINIRVSKEFLPRLNKRCIYRTNVSISMIHQKVSATFDIASFNKHLYSFYFNKNFS